MKKIIYVLTIILISAAFVFAGEDTSKENTEKENDEKSRIESIKEKQKKQKAGQSESSTLEKEKPLEDRILDMEGTLEQERSKKKIEEDRILSTKCTTHEKRTFRTILMELFGLKKRQKPKIEKPDERKKKEDKIIIDKETQDQINERKDERILPKNPDSEKKEDDDKIERPVKDK
ncbi:hypothetical protein KAU33_11525 [Candidatus Dependentiae bacterium]|nr:hypothetical protein [Candidatus Dependentiae bacterium]